MYFKQIEEIVDGTKRQTRRVAKDNEIARHARVSDGNIDTVHTERGSPKIRIRGYRTERLKWEVGRDYAVSPGRGKHGLWWHPKTGATKPPGETLGLYRVDSVGGVADGWQPLRIRILEIRREPLQNISGFDALAEGVRNTVCWWCGGSQEEDGGDCHVCCSESALEEAVEHYHHLWEQINGRGSWDKNPNVWALRFEVVRA